MVESVPDPDTLHTAAEMLRAHMLGLRAMRELPAFSQDAAYIERHLLAGERVADWLERRADHIAGGP